MPFFAILGRRYKSWLRAGYISRSVGDVEYATSSCSYRNRVEERSKETASGRHYVEIEDEGMPEARIRIYVGGAVKTFILKLRPSRAFEISEEILSKTTKMH